MPKYGFIRPDGEPAVECRFDAAWPFHEGLACVREVDQCGFIDPKGAFVIEPAFRAASGFSQGLAAVKVGALWGYVDKSGKTVIEPQFQEAGDFSEGRAAVARRGKFGYIDAKGKTVIESQFDGARAFSSGLAAVRTGEDWGFIDAEGRAVVRTEYGAVEDFIDGAALVQLRGEWKPIDGEGRYLLPPTPDVLGRPAEGLVPVAINGLWGYADMNGALVIRPQFADALPFSGGLAPAAVREESPEDTRGKRPAVLSRDEAMERSRSYTELYDGGRWIDGGFPGKVPHLKWGFVDRTGRWVVEPRYVAVGAFREGRAPVAVLPASTEKDPRKEFGPSGRAVVPLNWGIIDESGREVLPCEHLQILAFSEGLAMVRDKDGWRYVNRDGQFAFDHVYRWARPFSSGRAWVRIPAKDASGRTDPTRHIDQFIDVTGKAVIQGPFADACDFSDGLARVWGGLSIGADSHPYAPVHTAEGRAGYIDVSGTLVIEGDRHDTPLDAMAWRMQ
jgi:hypothetical protein